MPRQQLGSLLTKVINPNRFKTLGGGGGSSVVTWLRWYFSGTTPSHPTQILIPFCPPKYDRSNCITYQDFLFYAHSVQLYRLHDEKLSRGSKVDIIFLLLRILVTFSLSLPLSLNKRQIKFQVLPLLAKWYRHSALRHWLKQVNTVYNRKTARANSVL